MDFFTQFLLDQTAIGASGCESYVKLWDKGLPEGNQ